MLQKLIQCDRIVLWGFCLRLTWNTCICVLTVWISTVCDMCGFSIGYMFFLRWKCHLQRKNVLGIFFFDLFPLVSGVLQPNEVMQPWCCLHTWCLQVPVPKNGQTFLSVTPRAVATITKDGIDVWNCWNSKSFFFLILSCAPWFSWATRCLQVRIRGLSTTPCCTVRWPLCILKGLRMEGAPLPGGQYSNMCTWFKVVTWRCNFISGFGPFSQESSKALTLCRRQVQVLVTRGQVDVMGAGHPIGKNGVEAAGTDIVNTLPQWHTCTCTYIHAHKLTHHHPSITLIFPLLVLLFHVQTKFGEIVNMWGYSVL